MKKKPLKMFLMLLICLIMVCAALVFLAASPAVPLAKDWPQGSKQGVVTLPDAPVKTASSGTIRVMTYNIGYAYGDANNDHLLPPAAVKKNLDDAVIALKEIAPDILCLQEIDFDAHRSGGRDQLAYLQKALGFPFAAYAVNWNKRYLPFPYWPPANHFGRVVSGQAILSRFPILEHNITRLKRPPNPFWYDWFYLDRLAQNVMLDIDGQHVLLWNLHLEAFHRDTRLEQADAIATIVNNTSGPRIIVGDFNDPNAEDSPPPQDNAVTRIIAKTNFAPSPSQEMSFPSWQPIERFDHILFSSDFVVGTAATPSLTTSDHRPTWTDLSWKAPQ